MRTLEDPPGGGPLAGIDAGLSALGAPADAWVVVVSVDCPGIADVLRRLLAAPLGAEYDGRILRGGDPEPFDQYLMGVYRAGALRRALDEAPDADLVITAGGISAGAYEVVRLTLGTDAGFHHVAQQPGGPQGVG